MKLNRIWGLGEALAIAFTVALVLLGLVLIINH